MSLYRESELKEKALEFFRNDELAANIWIKKYALKAKEEGFFEELSPDDSIKRQVREIHRTELKYPNPLSEKEIYETLQGFKHFIFGGSIQFGIGNNNAVSSLGNCFFINNEVDSYGGIFNTDECMVQLMKRRGGVGITLEHLRPSGARVNNSAHSSTGSISFMNRFSASTREVAQDGRRGALMITMALAPDIEQFILSKNDVSKLTGANISVKVTDKFMRAVEENQDYILTWPYNESMTINEQVPYNKLVKLENGSYVKRVKARDIWNLIIKQAHKNAEPGVLFWDTILKESPADCYAKHGFVTQGTNPCVTGDTLVAVADGRNAISIKQLAEEDKDVPVYCLNDKGKIEIQLMRNPRITGYNQPIYKVNLDSGDSIKCTGNHKLRLKDGTYKEAKDLIYGDSLHVSTISYSPIVNEKNKNKKKHINNNYRWIKSGDETFGKGLSEHRLIYEFYNEKILENNIIHHIDYNKLNNAIDNLKMMSKKDHDDYHSKDMLGFLNPYHKMSDESKQRLLEASRFPGESNPNYSGISNYRLYRQIILFTKKTGRRISGNEWELYASKHGLPRFLNKNFRGGETYLFKRAATYLKYDFIDSDIKTLRVYTKALKNGYNAKIIDNVTFVEKTCEICGKKFWTNYITREHSFCSQYCAHSYINKKRAKHNIENFKKQGEEKTKIQLKIYSDLKFKLGRDPYQKEWEKACVEAGSTGRLRTKYGLKSWKEVKEHAASYNHKIISIELSGYENVYNGTVDLWHNYFNVLKPFDKITQSKQFIINQFNCGELPLNSLGTCQLGSINLFNFVNKPFTSKAKFDFTKLSKVAKFSQRFMDDIVDLEEEKIAAIIEKIKNDPETEEIKRTELNLWNGILNILKMGRRVGIGLLGEADVFAALGIKYGTPEATKMAVSIQKCIAINSYLESVNLAKERGAFPIWDADLEAKNPFIRRIICDNFDNKEYADYLKYGRRNIASLTIAPTGTLSLLCQTTSGIEPVFKIYHKRRRKINPNEEKNKTVFIDQNGDAWEEYTIIHYPFIQWFSDNTDGKMTFNGAKVFLEKLEDKEFDDLISKSPWAGSASHEIDYMEKINMQGVIQQYIDHSISVTHNVPEKISLEEVDKIYLHGWKVGCKGLTIYRDGSRSGVLISTKKDSQHGEFKESQAPKRPKVLPSDYYVSKADGKEFAVIVGRWVEKDGTETNKPFEIFAFENPPMNKNTKGKTIKVKKGHYKFVNGEFEIENIQLKADMKEEKTLTLTASMLLRHGAPLPHVINVIKKIDENVTSFSAVVRRCLSKYISEDADGEACPECGEKMIVQDGCMQCVSPSCGYSKC